MRGVAPYAANRALADKFEVDIRRILGEVFLVNDFQRDVEQNSDLVILESHRMTFSCRVRTYNNWVRFRRDITIRCRSNYGLETEIDKLIKGFGDFMFYGFVDEERENLIAYRIIDLDILRAIFIRRNELIKDAFQPYGPSVIRNPDGSAFIPINVDDIGPACVMNEILDPGKAAL